MAVSNRESGVCMYATKCGVCGESLEVCLDLLVAGQKAWLEFVFVQYFILRYAWRTTMEDDYQEVIYKYIKYIIIFLIVFLSIFLSITFSVFLSTAI